MHDERCSALAEMAAARTVCLQMAAHMGLNEAVARGRVVHVEAAGLVAQSAGPSAVAALGLW